MFKCIISGIKSIHIVVPASPHPSPAPFQLAKLNLYPLKDSSPFHPPLAPGHHHSACCFYEFDYSGYIPPVSGIVQYLSLCEWLISLSLRSSRFVQAVARIRMPFLFKAESYSIVCLHYIFCIHSSVHGHLGCLHGLVTVNDAAMSMAAHVSRETLLSIFLYLTVILCLIFWGPDWKYYF